MRESQSSAQRRPLLLAVVVGLLLGCPSEKPPPSRVARSVPDASVAPAVKRPAPVDRSRAVAHIVCPSSEGPAFFVAPDRVVARARFVCDAPRVKLFDGRTLLARVVKTQREYDLAELEVAGGEGEAVPAGSALELAETDDVQVPGGPSGTVRGVDRVRLGVPHFEVAFERLPAPGSLVVDGDGRAVGLVTEATLVLPIEAVGPAEGWAEVQQRAKTAAAREVAMLRRALLKPSLAAALVDASGDLSAVLLSRVPEPQVTLQRGTCVQTVKPGWEKFRVTAWLDPSTRELFQFIDAHDLDIGLLASTVRVPAGCAGAQLTLEGADPLLHQVAVVTTAVQVAETATPRVPVDAGPSRPVEVSAPGLDERAWRGRFQALKDEREAFERDLRDKQRFIEAVDRAYRRVNLRAGLAVPVMNADEAIRYDQYKKDLESADADRAVFQKKLDELEHDASNAAVPREWRR
ncbi:MAG: serine protease [Archangiaceae bacterium]|nr:serine protease [Archangiaceae bacterium]